MTFASKWHATIELYNPWGDKMILGMINEIAEKVNKHLEH